MSYSFDPLIQSLYSSSGTNTFTLRNGFVILLGLQLILRGEYNYPEDYLTRIFPLYQPYPGNFFLQFIIVPDNACQRSSYGTPTSINGLTFDYIVVGAGAAGATIASRLSENPARKVLLVEAGGDPATESVVPQFFAFSINNTNIWNYKANVVNTSSNAIKNGCGCPFGKQLGGSTGTNAMVYVCGNDRDYDSWAAQGNTGWDYASILPYIKKSENNTDSSIVGNGTYHSTGGLLTVSTLTNADPYVPTLKAAFGQLGYKYLKDYNSRTYNGFVTLQSTIKEGERVSSYRAFLAPVLNRTNLYFMKNSIVTKILFSGTKATGVNVWSNISSCMNIKLFATKEVIISAGTLGTTKILLQSGIGRSADLAPFGISQVQNLNVGNNLMDHVYAINFIKVNPGAANQTLFDILWQCQQYYFYPRTGPFTELGTVNAEGFINTLDVNATYPDIQYTFYRFPKSQEYLTSILSNFGYKDEFIAALSDLNAQYEIVMTFSTILNPKSRGTCKLRSSDPLAPPNITTGYFTHPDDVSTVLRGINKLQDLVNTQAMQNTSASFVKFNLPECNSLIYPSNDYWNCYIKYFSANQWHPSGTAKMGNSSADAVVDRNLKVYGITNLRVADASIMPTITTGNTQCPTYMIGEKAADIIKAAWP